MAEHKACHRSQDRNVRPRNVRISAASESTSSSLRNVAASSEVREKEAQKTPMSPLCVESPIAETRSPKNPYFNVRGQDVLAHIFLHNTTSEPFDRSPHHQDYYDRQWFRLLVALIFAVSLIEAGYGTYYSLLYDIEFAYLALMLSVTFSVVEVLLWAVIGVICMHFKRPMCRSLHYRTGLPGSKAQSLLRLIGWASWIAMLAANVGLKVYLDTT